MAGAEERKPMPDTDRANTPVNPAQKTSKTRGAAIIWLVGAVVVLVLLGVLLWYLCPPLAAGSGVGLSFALPVLAIVGVVVLLIALGMMAVAFGFFGLTEAKNALALPEGSVRAVVALSLVVLFAILSIFLYGGLSTGIEIAKGLSEDQMKSIVTTVPNVSIQKVDNTYTVTRGATPNQAAQDFAKQLLVMIGTLVTAVASFYFGGQIANSAQSAGVKAAMGGAGPSVPTPTLRGIKPPKLPAGQTADPFNIVGDDLNSVTRVRLIQGSNQIVGEGIKSNAHEVVCKVAIDANVPKGKYNVVVSNEDGKVRAELADAFEVT
jgi:hypothetical protein